MSKSITMSFPHSLGVDEVRRRIDLAIAEVRAQHPDHASSLRETWTTPTHGEFRLSTMGQTITGNVDILADNVQLAIQLPWLVATFFNRYRREIDSRVRKLLESQSS